MSVKKIFLLALLFPASLVHAEGIPIDSGLWEITMTMEMPMLPEPRVVTNTQCMNYDEISPETMGAENQDSDCQFEIEPIDGDTMKWTPICPTGDGTSRGEWEATSFGDTVTGEGLISADVQGQTMNITMSWKGKRIGECE
jgi:hypothetical protein